MCGLVGFVGAGDRDVLRTMRDTLTHRGPDAGGDWVDDRRRVHLGHRRLAIVDVQGGHQPMVSADQQVVLVFNGEIYNHRQLRSRLEARGHRYHTNCDSETILLAYQEWGQSCVHELEGMFAFVIYDRTRRQLFGARDRFGKKPLYYYLAQSAATPSSETGIDFAFASEVRALRAHPALTGKLQLDMDQVINYLLNDYLVGERSAFAEVRQLLPGSAFSLQLSDQNESSTAFRQWRFWEPKISAGEASAEKSVPSFPQATNDVRDLLLGAVESRLMSDVPLGAFVSGGIDSALIVAAMARLLPAREIKTFCIGFAESSFDESPFAAVVAEHFGTDHYCRQFTVRDMQQRLPDTIAALDQPFADPSILPVAMLSEFAREHVTVALGGDGGDELFVGYDPFRAVGPAHFCRRWLPAAVRNRLLKTLAGWIPASDRNLSLNLKVNRFLRGLQAPLSVQTPTWMGAFSLHQLRHLLPDFRHRLGFEDTYPEAITAFAKIAEGTRGGSTDLTAAIDFFQRFYLPDDILVKVDRASMQHSLEVRCPFLDRELAEYVNGLPLAYKYHRGVTKRILRHVASAPDGLGLPPAIVQRKKKGFGIPIGQWMRGPLRAEFARTLVHEWPNQLDMFNRDYVAKLFSEHLNRSADHYKELWALYVLARWTESTFASAATSQTTPSLQH